MSTDRDTLARDLLTLPALVEAPEEVVRGLVLRNPWGSVYPVRAVDLGAWAVGPMLRTPADLHAAGWRVDLDAPATAGVLLGLLAALLGGDGPALGRVLALRSDMLDAWLMDDAGAPRPTLAEAAARALVEVARG